MNLEFYRSDDDMVVGVLSVRLIIRGDEDKNNDFQMKGNCCVNKKNREIV